MRRYTIIVFLMLVVLSGCRKTRESIVDEQGVSVKMDWTNLKAGDTPFDKMELHFYDEHSNHIVKQGDQKGYTGELPVGNYSMLVFNPKAQNVIYESLENYSNAQIRTPSASSLTTLGKELMQPGNVYGCSVERFTIKLGAYTEVTALLKPYISIFNINVRLTGEVERVVGCRVKLSGITDMAKLVSGQTPSTNNKYIVISEDMVDSGFKTSLSIFGTNATAQNIMEVKLILDNGETLTIGKDISESIKEVNSPLSPNIDMVTEIGLNTKMGTLTATIISWSEGAGNADIVPN